jgi:multiple sugar transport system permease protein
MSKTVHLSISSSRAHRSTLRRSGFARRKGRTALLFLTPSLVILSVFVFYPMFEALRMSFTNDRFFGTSDFVGLENYARLLGDDRFWNALGNTALYAAVTAPVSVVLALVLALLLNLRLPGRQAFRTVIFLPYVVSLGIVSIAWAAMLDPQIGLLTSWFSSAGVSFGDGLRDPAWAMPAIIMVGVWRNVGFFMVMYLAGLQSIPRELLEAAQADGAKGFRLFWNVTWPLLANTTAFVFVVAAIFSFQVFDQIYVMTGGGPFFSTESLVMLIYGTGFRDYELGYAAAISWVLVLLVGVFSLLQMRYFSKRAVQY